MMDTDLYATREEIDGLKALAKRLGRNWADEISRAMRGDRMRRTRYDRLLEVLEKAAAALGQRIAKSDQRRGRDNDG